MTRRRSFLLPLAAIIVLGILTSCAVGPTPRWTGRPSAASVHMDCALMLSDEQAADLTPPLTPIPDYVPTTRTLGARMVAQGGRACGWQNGSVMALEVVAALPSDGGLASAEKSASEGEHAAAPLAKAAYFAVGSDHIGRAQIFMGSYWIEVASPAFTTADEAESVYFQVIRTLRSAGG